MFWTPLKMTRIDKGNYIVIVLKKYCWGHLHKTKFLIQLSIKVYFRITVNSTY